jgi:hypothetical protein
VFSPKLVALLALILGVQKIPFNLVLQIRPNSGGEEISHIGKTSLDGYICVPLYTKIVEIILDKYWPWLLRSSDMA